MKGPSGPTVAAQFSACCSSKLKCIQRTAGSIVAFIVQLNLLDLTQQARNKHKFPGSFMSAPSMEHHGTIQRSNDAKANLI